MTFAGRQGEEIQKLQIYVDSNLPRRSPVRLLEAGCGSATYLDFGEESRLVGIDISKKQLERNDRLHEKILGDLQSYEFPPESFDAIICWDVLEHLPTPEKAIVRLCRALKPGGLVILKLPNILSLKGLVTKFFPHKFHVLAYRYFYGDKNAGKDDNVPFRTYLRLAVSAMSLRRQGDQLGMIEDYYATYDAGEIDWLRRKPLVHLCYTAVKRFLGLLSLGTIGDSELIIVLRKASAHAEQVPTR